MNIVHGSKMDFIERANPRGGVFRYKSLFEYEAGSADSFYFSISQTFADFFSPRHRHNFDQIRFQLEGTSPFAHDGDMKPGSVGYFPEGTHYGPQTATGEAIVLVLQFGGASGYGYMGESQLQRSIADLKQVGEFKDGVFFRRIGEGRPQQDAYEASWEHWSGRKLEYPSPRYGKPVMMSPDAFAWVADETRPGVEHKHLGSFNELGTAISFHRLAPDASCDFKGPMVAYVTSGDGSADGNELLTESALHVGKGEVATISTSGGIEMFTIQLPRIAARPVLETESAAAAG